MLPNFTSFYQFYFNSFKQAFGRQIYDRVHKQGFNKQMFWNKGPFNIYKETGPVFGTLRGRKKVKPC